MTLRVLHQTLWATICHARHEELAELVRERGGADLLLTDTPYSEKTHRGHDGGVTVADRYEGRGGRSGIKRRKLSYPPWTPDDVIRFVDLWVPLTQGWFVTLTDHVLAPVWAAALEDAGRYVFAPLPCVEPGSRVRVRGDGPTNWACQLVAARPRTFPYTSWGALPGAYVVPPGQPRRTSDVVGAKPLWLMERLVEDYSRDGELVVDPCVGGGTTALAAQRLGRRVIGGDADLTTARKAASAMQEAA